MSAAVGLCAPGSGSGRLSSAETGSILACKGGHVEGRGRASASDFGQVS